ncbi:MAG: hypothetical protein ACPL5F_03715 [Moorellaceae bacterium]
MKIGLEELADDHGLAYALENEKMLLVAERILRSALLRDENLL